MEKAQIRIVAGRLRGRKLIVAVHESQESWERFRNEILMPRMAEGIEGGFTVPPQETAFPVHKEQTG